MNKKVLLILLICSLCNCLYAQDSQRLETELESIDLQLHHLIDRIAQSDKQIKRIDNLLTAKRKEITEIKKQIEKLDNQKQEIETRAEQIRQKFREGQQKIRQLLETSKARLVQLHKIKQNTLIGSIFAAKDVNSFLTRFEMVKYLIKNDNLLLQQLHKEEEIQRETFKKLQQSTLHVQQLSKELEDNKAKLLNENSSQNAMLSTLKLERELFEDRKKRLNSSKEEIEKQIRHIESEYPEYVDSELVDVKPFIPDEKPKYSPEAPEGAKKLNSIWPVKRDDIHDVRPSGSDNLLLIKLKNDAEIRAVAKGKVLYRGTIGALGNVIILAHESGFSSVYGYLDEMWVGLGEIVPQYEPIAKVFSSNSTGNFHFEIRFGGRRQQPLDYLPILDK